MKTTQNAKLQKQSNKDQFASIWRQNDLKCWVTSQNILNNAKLQNWSNYNELHRFDVKTIIAKLQTIKLQWIASIWCQNDQNNAKLQKWSNYNELHWFDVKTFKTFELGRKTTKGIKLQWSAMIWYQNNQKCRVTSKTFKTTQNYKSDQITMNCIDLMSKRSKIAKLQKQSNYDQFASIWRQNDQKCWVTSQNILNNAKLQNWSNYNELHRFDVKTIKNRKTTKVIKLQWIASIWCQNDQNNAKLQKWSNYNELHWFDVKTFKTFELGRKTTKVIKLQWSAMIWYQNNQKCRVTS